MTPAQTVLVKSDELFSYDLSAQPYDQPREISQYLLMHFGSFGDLFGRPGHPLGAAYGYPHRLSAALRTAAETTGVTVRRALDVGCNVGGLSVQAAGWVQDLVLGIDVSPRAIEVARSVVRHGGGVFSVLESGPFTRQVEIRLPAGRARVEFAVADAGALTALPAVADGFDAVLLSNVLDRVEDPVACLQQFAGSDRILPAGGLLLVACPWSWDPRFSHPGSWLGSDRGVDSGSSLRRLLGRGFDLICERDEPGVLRHNPREYDYFESQVTVWRKR
jgi:SAM-dependent methyltransferase